MKLNLSLLAEALERRVECPVLARELKANHEPPQSDDGGSREPILIVREHERSSCGCKYVEGSRKGLTIPDPALDKLRAIVWGDCPLGPYHKRHFGPDGCHGTKRALRTAFWDAAGEGALAGAVVRAIIGWTNLAGETERDIADWIVRVFMSRNPNQNAVNEAIRLIVGSPDAN